MFSETSKRKMKLLGWMHRKLRQNNSETFTDFSIGHPLLDGQHHHQRQYGMKPIKQGYREYNLQKSFAGLGAARIEEEEEEFDENSSATNSQLFHGFLAIGTLGADTVIKDPSTPTFSISIDNITESETEVTENELKLINDELERVLAAETMEDVSNDASRRDGLLSTARNSHASTGRNSNTSLGRNSNTSLGRNSYTSLGRNSYTSTGRSSHVSTGTSSHGCIITLSGKTMEGTDTNGNKGTICPLQGYLLGSGIELPETTVSKKEYRTSLGELFQKNRLADETYGANKKRTEKEGDNPAVHLMKKLLKKKILPTSRSSAGTTGGINVVDSDSAETKLHKILHMFHKKVHPESMGASKENRIKPQHSGTKKNVPDGVGYTDEDPILQDDDIIIIPQRPSSKTNIRCHKIQSNQTQRFLKKEQWIKTDADYLVLEL